MQGKLNVNVTTTWDSMEMAGDFVKLTPVFAITENNTIDLLAITSLHCGMRVDKQGVGEGAYLVI